MVRTSRCGRDNLGSNPSTDKPFFLLGFKFLTLKIRTWDVKFSDYDRHDGFSKEVLNKNTKSILGFKNQICLNGLRFILNSPLERVMLWAVLRKNLIK